MIAPGAQFPRWNVPYKQNPFFTGREEILKGLHYALYAENAVALSHPQGISGLGGIGKTQTAIEYAYRYRGEYDVVLWVQADSSSALIASYVDLARLLDIPEQAERDQSIIVEAVLRWLRLHTGWLLIFDNVDDLSVTMPFLPKAGPGHTLLTTRAHALGGIAQPLEVPKMESETGALLLLRRASILPHQAALNLASKDDYKVACEISQELDGLPLALDQAGAYIKETPCTLTDYIALYQTRRSDLLQTRGSLGKDYPASVATTWSLSIEKVSQANSAAVELLNFCAFLAPDAIPEEMITKGAQHFPPSLQSVVALPFQFDQAVAALLAYSLISRNTNVTLNIHRLVQAVLQDMLKEDERRAWIERAMLAINTAFPRVEHSTWQQCELLQPHALLAAQFIDAYQINRSEAGRLLYQTAWYLKERARYQEAEPLYQRALHIREEQLGPNHPDMAITLNGLAILYDEQDRYIEAEPLYQRALRIREEQLGPNHPDVASVLNNLALLYYKQGRHAEAEQLYQRALRIREEQLGPDHPDVASSLNDLAILYRVQGRYAEAEQLYQRALRIWEQQLGSDHPQVAYPLNNLAILYDEQGRYIEAEPLYQRALRIREEQLGPDHPYVTYPLNNLAVLYRELGKYTEAEQLNRRALRILEQQLGPDHLQVTDSLDNLAVIYDEQGKYVEAERFYQRSLRIREKQLGPDHPDVAYPLSGLADLYYQQSKYTEAEQLFQRALHIREQRLGSDHPKVAILLNNLADLYVKQGKYVEAEQFYQRSLRIREKQWGPDHPKMAYPLNGLANLYQVQGRYIEAEQLYQRALRIWEQQLGSDHPQVADPLGGLATLYSKQGKYAEAELLYQRALHICERARGSQHPDTADVAYGLALLHEAQDKGEDAIIWYARALAIREQALGAQHPKTQETRKSLIALLHSLGRHEEVARLEATQSEIGKGE